MMLVDQLNKYEWHYHHYQLPIICLNDGQMLQLLRSYLIHPLGKKLKYLTKKINRINAQYQYKLRTSFDVVTRNTHNGMIAFCLVSGSIPPTKLQNGLIFRYNRTFYR